MPLSVLLRKTDKGLFIIASQSTPARPVPRHPYFSAIDCFISLNFLRAASPDTTRAAGTSFDSREPPSAAFRRSAPWRIDRAFPVSRRASHRRRRRPRTTGRALPVRPWPGRPERQRLPRSPSLHGPASRGAPSHHRVPDRLHCRHPEPEKNAIAGRIHARGACARSRREPGRRRSGAIAAPQGPAAV